MVKLKDRFGVLEVQEINGDMYLVTCLVHTERRPMKLTAKQLETATQCLACCNESAGLRKNATKLTGQTFGGYVAIKLMGLSIGAATIKRNQRQWKGKAKLQHNYCQHRYWLCYCRHCYKEREIRGDVLRSESVPKCNCKR